MEVKLISWTKDPLGTVAHAASMCYDSEPSRKIIKGCIRSSHFSILEHSNYTFEISGVSRSFLAQITRHRHASYSVQSQRYVSMGEKIDYIEPVLCNDEVSDIYNWAVEDATEAYNSMINAGAKPEDARAVLPNAAPTKMVVTMNLRGLMNFMNERLCSRAQTEIRKVAKAIKEAILNCPDHTEEDKEIINKILVPKCERFEVHFCPELKSCGRYDRLKDLIPSDKE